jgi:iron complex outermembrane receptor protein
MTQSPQAPLTTGDLVSQIDFTYCSNVCDAPTPTDSAARQAPSPRPDRPRLDGGGCELSVWGKNLFDTTNISDVAPIADSDFNLFSMGRARVCSVYFRVRY